MKEKFQAAKRVGPARGSFANIKDYRTVKRYYSWVPPEQRYESWNESWNESAPDDEGTGKGPRRYDREPAQGQQVGRAT